MFPFVEYLLELPRFWPNKAPASLGTAMARLQLSLGEGRKVVVEIKFFIKLNAPGASKEASPWLAQYLPD
jgi:hypothetical protein